jgi:hypothetical protein
MSSSPTQASMAESDLPKTPLEVFNSIPPKSPLFRHICRELTMLGKLDLCTFRFSMPLEVAAVGLTKEYLSDDLKKSLEKPARKPAEPKAHVNKGMKKIYDEEGKVRWVTPKEFLQWKLEHIDEERDSKGDEAEEVSTSSAAEKQSEEEETEEVEVVAEEKPKRKRARKSN